MLVLFHKLIVKRSTLVGVNQSISKFMDKDIFMFGDSGNSSIASMLPALMQNKGMDPNLVAALMNDSPIIILDEPTTGLDPLMRQTFLDIIKEEHKKGKTIFMSSHGFDELEATCDRVALISDGHIIDQVNMDDIRNPKEKDFKIEFKNEKDYRTFQLESVNVIRLQEQYNQVTIRIRRDKTGDLLKTLKHYDVKFISEIPYTLEKHFKKVFVEQKEAQKNVQ